MDVKGALPQVRSRLGHGIRMREIRGLAPTRRLGAHPSRDFSAFRLLATLVAQRPEPRQRTAAAWRTRMPTIVVDVMPKAELLDPQGKAVAGALSRLEVGGITGVRIGKRFELTVDAADEQTLASVKKIADEILSNAVIEDVVGIEVVE